VILLANGSSVVVLGWVGLGQSGDRLGWTVSHNMDNSGLDPSFRLCLNSSLTRISLSNILQVEAALKG